MINIVFGAEKLARRGLRVPDEYEADALHQVTVGQMMVSNTVNLPETMRVRELTDRIAKGEADYVRHQAFPIVGANGRLTGIITRGDLPAALDEPAGGDLCVLDAGTRSPYVAYPDEILHDALDRLLRHDIGRLPVVSRDDCPSARGPSARRPAHLSRQASPSMKGA